AHPFAYQFAQLTQQVQARPTTVTPGSVGPMAASGQATTLLHAFTAGTRHGLATGAWNFDTSASSHLNNSVTNLSEVFNSCMYPSVSVGDGHSIPVTNTGQFVRDNNCTIEFDAFSFSVKDFITRRVLLRCDSTGDLYPVTHPSPIPRAFLVSQHTWHQRFGHPGGDMLRRLVLIMLFLVIPRNLPFFAMLVSLAST
nr:ribonuclease H-like domain-containing protein [Tanacetum cinerariifolium]